MEHPWVGSCSFADYLTTPETPKGHVRRLMQVMRIESLAPKPGPSQSGGSDFCCMSFIDKNWIYFRNNMVSSCNDNIKGCNRYLLSWCKVITDIHDRWYCVIFC